MKKAFICFVSIIFTACSGNDPAIKTTDNNPADNYFIKYPLPTTADSLIALLQTLPEDTNKINVLSALARKWCNSKPDTSSIIDKQALALAEKLSASPDEIIAKAGKKGMARAYRQLGIDNALKGDYPNSLDYYLKALQMNEELLGKDSLGGDKSGIAILLGNIGNIYVAQKDYSKALEYYSKALKIAQERGNKIGIALYLGNIGVANEGLAGLPNESQALRNQSLERALDYYFKALAIDEELNDKNLIARHLGNIGNIYYKQTSSESENGDTNDSLAKGYSKASPTERNQSFGRALEYFSKALKLCEEIGDKFGASWNLANIGSIYAEQKKYRDAYGHCFRALAVSDSIQATNLSEEIYKVISSLYEKSTLALPDSIGGKMLNMEQMRLRSLHYFKSYINLRDTLFSQENKKQLVRKEMNFEFEKKEAATKAENDKKEALGNEQLKQKENERNYFIAGFALVVLLAGFIFRGYRQKQKANEIISKQKLVVEEKQKEILDSIHYAKRIQQSLLPTEKYIQKNIKKSSKN